ncbi:MAG: ribosome small subunit-dependent GTPase A [Spirochaetes bacterium]|nr:ribosome small subunit-dependent GTPase A [Spirochaetota bacterium]NLJ05969.1 ribosome small subunit-dependent GTPase A [Exilispira sp.]HPB47626.1 ribosome small subunit-dependent GTPase A [Exilispira sp.]HQQ19837.1 ribosome small subunit-dependent GTPase A [Exilispira sp.]
MSILKTLGWNDFFESSFNSYCNLMCDSFLIPGRVISENKNSYLVKTEKGEFNSLISGKFRYDSIFSAQLPAVGDWVVLKLDQYLNQGIIYKVLERKNFLCRQSIDNRSNINADQQIIASNIDTVFLVVALGRDFNISRIERYLLLVQNSGASCIIILNKSDLVDSTTEYIEKILSIKDDISVYPISAKEKYGLDYIKSEIKEGKTYVFVGSSGAGKSTIINELAGFDLIKTNEVRKNDERGRHTTTSRNLIVLPGGGIVIDNPGMREIEVFADEDDLDDSFNDIKLLADKCRFIDCSHTHEPDCAVKEAIEKGILDERHFKNYLKLQKEIKLLKEKEKNKIRKINRSNLKI